MKQEAIYAIQKDLRSLAGQAGAQLRVAPIDPMPMAELQQRFGPHAAHYAMIGQRNHNGQSEEEEIDQIRPTDAAHELTEWLAEKPIPMFRETQFLPIWKSTYSSKYPNLYKLVLKYCCIPISAAAVERVWSAAGRILTSQRLSLSDNSFQQAIFLKVNSQLHDINVPKTPVRRTLDSPIAQLAPAIVTE